MSAFDPKRTCRPVSNRWFRLSVCYALWLGADVKRREFIALLGSAAAALPLAAAAQPKIPRIGFMGNSTAALEANLLDAFREGLRELGYEEGRNIVIEYRWANGKYDHFPVLVAELIAAKVDAIVTAGTPAALAVKNATTTVPLVMVAVGDPIGTGLVPSLARPGGNLTGLSSIAPDLEGKRLQLLREVTPALSHVAMFINSLNPFHISSMEQARAAAQAMGIKLRLHDIRKSERLCCNPKRATGCAAHLGGPRFPAQSRTYSGLRQRAAAAERECIQGTR